jgi:hypothetical protein
VKFFSETRFMLIRNAAIADTINVGIVIISEEERA